MAFAWPGNGRWWRWRTGGREPSPRERETFDDALADVTEGTGASGPRAWFVLDSAEPAAAVRERTVTLTRALLAMPGALSGVLANELAHANMLDGRLTEALNRLVLWPGALLPPGGLVRGVLRAALFLAGGGLSLRVLGAAWGGYWRGEYAADSYAADLGAGDDLARFLEQNTPLLRRAHPLPLAHRTRPPTDRATPRTARKRAGTPRKPLHASQATIGPAWAPRSADAPELGPARVEDGRLGTFVASSWVSAPSRRAGAAVPMN